MTSNRIQIYELYDMTKVQSETCPETVVVCDHLLPADILKLSVEQKVKHIVQKSNYNFDSEVTASKRMILNPDSFFKFPLSTILLGEEAQESAASELQLSAFSRHFCDPSQKQMILDEFEALLILNIKSSSLRSDILLVADEILTNAIYNAPYGNIQDLTTGSTRDKSKITIDPAKAPHIFASVTDEQIFLGCTDYYGTLNTNLLLQKILSSYSAPDLSGMINFGAGGAGIGSVMVFNACTSYYIGVRPGLSTTICCSFPRSASNLKRQGIPKNLHVVVSSASS